MNSKWIEKILIISIFAGFSCHAAQIPINKILASNLDYFFIHPNNAVFNEYKNTLLTNPVQTKDNATSNTTLMCTSYNTLFFNDSSKLFNFAPPNNRPTDLNLNINTIVQALACSPDSNLIAAAAGANIIISSSIGKKYIGLMDAAITSLAL